MTQKPGYVSLSGFVNHAGHVGTTKPKGGEQTAEKTKKKKKKKKKKGMKQKAKGMRVQEREREREFGSNGRK